MLRDKCDDSKRDDRSHRCPAKFRQSLVYMDQSVSLLRGEEKAGAGGKAFEFPGGRLFDL